MGHRAGRVRARLGDVLRLSFCALAAVKAVDVHIEYGWWLVVVWVAVCGLAAWRRPFLYGLAALAGGCWLFASESMQSTHAVLLGLTAAWLATEDERLRMVLLRHQVTALYLFAALNKINGNFLGGETIHSNNPALPAVPLAVAAVATEAWLAWAVWSRHRWALAVAAALHTGIVVMMSTSLYEWTMLGAYNSMLVLLVWATTRGPGREEAPAPTGVEAGAVTAVLR